MQHEPDGNFPNGVPNPLLPERRQVTADAVRLHQADLGIAYDGDADRCFFIDGDGDLADCPVCGAELYQRDDDNETTVRSRLSFERFLVKPLVEQDHVSDLLARAGLARGDGEPGGGDGEPRRPPGGPRGRGSRARRCSAAAGND